MNSYKGALIVIIAMASILAIATPTQAQGFSLQGMNHPVLLDESVTITATVEFGPGSTVPLRDPPEPGSAWLSNTEPMKGIWTIYDPTMHKIYTMEEAVSYKQKGSFQGGDGSYYTWMWFHQDTFTLPAFAERGNWYAFASYEMANGMEIDGYAYYMPVTKGGTILGTIFSYPNYLFGMKFPALFWIPGVFLWLPGAIIIGCAIYARSIKGIIIVFKGARKATREAREEWRRKAGI